MLCDEIAKIEYIAKVRKNKKWYYHGVASKDRLSKILESGLMCENLMGYSRTRDGYNGRYYISLSKDVSKDIYASGYSQYIDKYPMIIIENILAFKCLNLNRNTIFTNTVLPFRTSGYKDEYQAFNRISSRKFRGIEAKAYAWAQSEKMDELKELRDIILLMNEEKLSLPIYDYSREEDGVIHEIDKEKYLQFSKRYF